LSFSERFNILNFLGEGAYGEVYQAFDTLDGAYVALKHFVVQDNEQKKNKIKLLQREIAFMKSLPAIPQFIHFKGHYEVDNKWIIVLEFCDAGSLLDIMDICEITLFEEQITVVACEVLKAFKVLHAQHKLHRDIKAGNILLTSKGECKIADFGTSVNLDPEGLRYTTIGTPYWMAPEMFYSKAKDGYNEKIDIWALGITCMELAKGAPPRSEIHPMRAIFKIPIMDPPVLPDPENWSESFKNFLSLCLIKDPKKRKDAIFLLEHPFIKKNKGIQILKDLTKKFMPQIKQFRISESKQRNHEDSKIKKERMSRSSHSLSYDTGDSKPYDSINGDSPNGGTCLIENSPRKLSDDILFALENAE